MEMYKPSKLAMQRTFFVCGMQLKFSEGFDDFNAVRVAFNRRAFKAQVEMTECYEKQIHSIEQLLTTGVSIMNRINQESAEFAVSVLMHYGIETVTPEKMTNLYTMYYEPCRDGEIDNFQIMWKSVFGKLIKDNLEPIKAKISAVTDFQNELSLQRQVQRASRSKWQGGGFGFSGAIKGAMMAGMMNAGTSVFRGIGDSFVNSSDAARVQTLKSSVMNGGMPLANFNYIVKTYVLYLYEIVKGYLTNTMTSSRDRKPGVIQYLVSKRDVENAIGKFQNYELYYKNGAKSADEVKKAIMEYMLTNIWDINALRSLYLLSDSAADKKSIINLTPYLGMQYEFANIALNIDEDLIEAAEGKVSEAELGRIRKDVKERAELIDFLITANEEQIEKRFIAQNYINQNGFYIEKSSLNGASEVFAQENYSVTNDEEANTFIVSLNGVHFNGKIKLHGSDFIYEGDFTDGRITGQGRVEFTNGIVAEGKFKDFRLVEGKRDTGKQTFEGIFQYDKEKNKNYYVKGKLTFTEGGSYEGEFSGFNFHGYGVLTYISGNTYKGKFVNDKQEGNGMYTTSKYEFVGLFSDGKMVNGTVTYKNGESYTGDIQNNSGVGNDWYMQGKGTYIYKDEVYEGDWHNDKRHGFGILKDKDGSIIYSGEWVNNARKTGGFFTRLKDKFKG